MEWCNELILEFLDLYEREEPIWNVSHPDYKNRHAVYDAWKRIQEHMSVEFSVAELKKKKESLMASFRTCRNKVRQSRKNGEYYQPVWFAYEKIASFLQKSSNIDNLKDEERQSNIKSGSDDSDNGDPLLLHTRTYKQKPQPTRFRHPVRKVPISNIVRRPLLKKRKILRTAHDITEPSEKTNVQPKDDCDIYGDLVASKLRKMDERSRDIAMNRIDNLLFQMKINYYSYQNSNQNSSTPTNQNTSTSTQASSSTTRITTASSQSPTTYPQESEEHTDAEIIDIKQFYENVDE